jgi:hypothetical protein
MSEQTHGRRVSFYSGGSTMRKRKGWPSVLYVIRSWDDSGEPIYDVRETIDELSTEESNQVAICKVEQIKTLKVEKTLV